MPLRSRGLFSLAVTFLFGACATALLVFAALVATDPGDNLALTGAALHPTPDGRTAVVARLENRTDRDYRHVRVVVSLVRPGAEVAGTGFIRLGGLAAGEARAVTLPLDDAAGGGAGASAATDTLRCLMEAASRAEPFAYFACRPAAAS